MIRFFRASRMTAVWGSAVGAFAGAAAAWVFYPGDGGTKAVLALVAAALAVNVCLYIAKIIAVRRYQEILLLLYEKLDPEAFLAQALPLLDRKAGTADRVTHAVHVANGLSGERGTGRRHRPVKASAGAGAGGCAEGPCGLQPGHRLPAKGGPGRRGRGPGGIKAGDPFQALQGEIPGKGPPHHRLPADLPGCSKRETGRS